MNSSVVIGTSFRATRKSRYLELIRFDSRRITVAFQSEYTSASPFHSGEVKYTSQARAATSSALVIMTCILVVYFRFFVFFEGLL